MNEVIVTDFTVDGEEVEWNTTVSEDVYVHALENGLDTVYYAAGADSVVHKGPLIEGGTAYEYRLMPVVDEDVDLRRYLNSTEVPKLKLPVYYNDDDLTFVSLLVANPDWLGEANPTIVISNFSVLLSSGIRQHTVLLSNTSGEHIYHSKLDGEVKGDLYLNPITGIVLFKQYDEPANLDTWYNLTPIQTSSIYKDAHTDIIVNVPKGCLIETRVLSRRAPEYSNEPDKIFELTEIYPPE